MGVVAEIADTVAVMRFGKVVEQGDTQSLFGNPQHPYTRDLLASVLELERPEMRRAFKRGGTPFGQPVIQVDSLKKGFGSHSAARAPEILAVDGASLELRAGENLGIVGESGSGKTTLGRCIQRIYTVSAGSVLYTDTSGYTTDLAQLDDAALRSPWRDIRTVFQDPFASLNPRMTVEQLIGEPLYTMGKSKAAVRDRVAELLELVGLPSSAMSRYPHAFSGGQRHCTRPCSRAARHHRRRGNLCP
jgi:peptide/nickel transport system ATP-binding protein